MVKKIITILSKLFLLNWPNVFLQDVSGSKASLIAKGTPRKRKVKKKVKKTPEPGDTGEFFDNALAEDLSVIQDDIVTEDTKKKDKDYTSQQYSVASNVPRSQPTEKFYIETDSKCGICSFINFR